MQKRHLFIIVVTAIAVGAFQWWPTERGGDAPAEQSAEVDGEPDGEGASAEEEASHTQTESDPSEEDLVEQIPTDERAYALELTDNGDLHRMLQPGDRVDIIGLFDGQDYPDVVAERLEETDQADLTSEGEWVATPLLQNVYVFETHPPSEDGREDAMATVSVTSEELMLLEATRRAGRLRITVRPEDYVAIDPIRFETLQGMLQELETLHADRRARFSKYAREEEDDIRIIRGEEAEDDGGDEEDGDEEREEVRPKVDCQRPLAERFASEAVGDDLRGVHVDVAIPTEMVDCGDRVDVFGSFDVDEEGNVGDLTDPKDHVTEMLLPDVAVLGVTGRGLVVAADAHEQLLLELAELDGDLNVGLRNEDDVLESPDQADGRSVPEQSFGELLRELKIIDEARKSRCCVDPPSDTAEPAADADSDIELIR